MNTSENSPSLPPVAIIGMHRSGTSLVARILNLAGFSLGPEDDLVGATAHNQAGHWESQTALAINTTLLRRFGGDWDYPPLLPEDWIEAVRHEPVWKEACHFVTAQAESGKAWAWKEPRTTLTLAFWTAVLHSLEMPQPRVLVCVRNPLDVAASLAARDHMSLSQALVLWHWYTDAALRQAPEGQYHIISYELLMSDFQTTFTPVLDFLKMPTEQSYLEKIAQPINPQLRHHQHSLADVLACDAMSETAKQLYNSLHEGPAATEAFLQKSVLSEQEQTIMHLQLKTWALEKHVKHLQAILNTRSHRIVDTLRNKFAHLPIFHRRTNS